MSLIPEWAPNIHPLLIHFPIGILLLAIFMNAVSFFISEEFWDELKTSLLYVLGTISTVVAYYTGTWAADQVFLPAEAQGVLNEHAGWAEWTLWFFVGYMILRLILHGVHLMHQQQIRALLLFLALPGLFFLYETGEYGGKMVYGYGVETDQLVQVETEMDQAADTTRDVVATGFKSLEGNNWVWQMGPGAVSGLVHRFNWLAGDVKQVRPVVERREGEDNSHYSLLLRAHSEPVMMIYDQAYQDVQVDYQLDLSQFAGIVTLMHHVQDANNYDFVILKTRGRIQQGRMVEGEPTIFAEQELTLPDQFTVRAVAKETHFRAYLDKEMAVHGHGEAPQPGQVGLSWTGTGQIRMAQMALVDL
jgi:uncharacterized membrane protein